MLVGGELPHVVRSLVILGENGAHKAPCRLGVLAGGGDGHAAADVEAAAVAGGGGVAHEGDIAAMEQLLILHVAEGVKIGSGEHLLAGAQAAILGVGAAIVVVLPVKLLGEGVGEVQHVDEFLAIKAAGLVRPVDEAVHAVAHTGVEDIGLDIRLAKDRSILTQLFLGLLEILERPGVPIAHNVGVAGHSVDGEAAHHLVEFSIHGHDVEEMGHKILAAELAVTVNERPQIHENALALVLLNGQAVGAENVRHLARENLGVQLLDAGIVIVVGVVLGVVHHVDAHLVLGAVELHNLVAEIPVSVEPGQGDLFLGRQRGGVHPLDGDQVVLLLHGLLIIGALQRHDGAVGLDGKLAHLVAVDVAVQPGEHPLALLGLGIVAVDGAVVVVEEGILVVAGVGVVGAVGQRDDVLAERLGRGIHQRQAVVAAVLAVKPHVGIDLAVVEPDQVVDAVFHRDRGHLLALAVKDQHIAPVGTIEVTGIVGQNGTKISAVLCLDLQRGEQRAVGTDVDEGGTVDLLILRIRRGLLGNGRIDCHSFRGSRLRYSNAVVGNRTSGGGGVSIELLVDPDAAVRAGDDGVDGDAALHSLGDGAGLVGLHGADLHGVHLQLEEPGLIGAVCNGLAGLVEIGLAGLRVGGCCLAHSRVAHKVDLVAAEAHAVNIFHFERVVDLQGGKGGLIAVLGRIGIVFVPIGGIGRFLIAPGQQPHQRETCQQQCQHSFFHIMSS